MLDLIIMMASSDQASELFTSLTGVNEEENNSSEKVTKNLDLTSAETSNIYRIND